MRDPNGPSFRLVAGQRVREGRRGDNGIGEPDGQVGVQIEAEAVGGRREREGELHGIGERDVAGRNARVHDVRRHLPHFLQLHAVHEDLDRNSARNHGRVGTAASLDAGLVALSFVRSVEDIRFVQKEMKQRQLKAKIIAKIETQRALDSLEQIIDACDGIMVARGDLAVEAAIEQVPFYQKNIIKKCIEKGKFVITATQMLLSMAANPFPTRAEVSDVANAVYDQTDAVMLSEETAMGKYPLATVQMMSKILSFHDYAFTHPTFMPKPEFNQIDQDIASQICDAAYDLYLEYSKSQQDFGGFVVFTQTGKTAQLLSRYRPQAPIFVFTPNAKNCEMLAPNFGIIAFKHPVEHGQEVTRKEVKNIAQLLLEKQLVQKNQKVIILHGDYWGVEGGTSTVRVVQI